MLKTSVKRNKRNPEWDEIFVCNDIPQGYVRMRLEVWDWDKYTGDDFMGKCEIDFAKWDMVKECYVPRVENLNLKEHERLDFPVDKTEFELFPDKDKKERPTSKVQGSLTFSLTRERLTEGTFMN